MKDNPIGDIACSVFRHIQVRGKYTNKKLTKGEFLVECIIEFMQIKKLDYLIVKASLTVTLQLEGRKLSFWIVEIPELNFENEYIEYLHDELVSIFYK